MIPAAEQSMDQRAPMLPFPPSAGSSNNNDDCEMLPIPFSANERPHLLGHSPALLTFDAPHYQPICSTGSPGPNAPPPSACGTASDHSGSACPSPGPIKRFRQIYGDHQLLQQHQSGPTSSSSCSPAIQENAVINKKPAMNWTENWMSAHYQFSRPGTSTSASSLLKCQQSSQTPSIMSTGSMISQISAISVDTQLSVAVDLLNLEQPNFVPAQLPDISSVTSNSTFIENVDPCYFQQMQYYLTQILEHLASMDENREFDAVCQLYRIGKDGQFMYCSESAQMMQVVQRLVEITLRPNTKQRTKTLTLNVLSKIAMAGNICLSAIRSLETADRGYFLNAIVLCLRSETEDYSRYATNILSVLFTHPTMGEFFRRQMRTQAVIRELMLALQQENYGFRHKFLRHIYYLIKPSRELKRFVHLSNGMQTCLEIFQRSVDERMLHGCSALILLLIDGLGRTAADHFVSTHGIQILATRLDHGSPRLLQCIARCLAAASDSDQIAHQSMDDAIRLSIQLLASTDADLVRHVVGFIANVQTKHRGAKEFLQRNKAIPNLMFLLSVWVDSKPSLAAGHKCGEEEETGGSTVGSCKHITLQKTGIDDIIDTVLLALNNLSNGVNADPAVTCQAIMELPNAHLLFLQLLASPNRPEIVYNRTLTLLGRILSSLPAAIGTAVLERLMYASVTKEGQQQQGYAHILLEIFFNACSKICAQQKADKEVKTMAFRSLYVLNELIKYPFFLGTTASLISAQNWNPFWLLGSLRDEELETAYMQFLYLLSASPDILAQWAFYEETLRVYTKIPHLSVLAVKIFNRIHKCIVNHHHNNCNINSKDNAFNVNNTG